MKSPEPGTSDWRHDIESALTDFLEVARLAGVELRQSDLNKDFQESPHLPPSGLPVGTMALYAFHSDGKWLKIGIAGSRSQARYVSQHYNAGSAPSTLSASLLRCPDFYSLPNFKADAPGDWIKSNCHRVNVLLDAKHGRLLLTLLEAFLHVRLRPRFER